MKDARRDDDATTKARIDPSDAMLRAVLAGDTYDEVAQSVGAD